MVHMAFRLLDHGWVHGTPYVTTFSPLWLYNYPSCLYFYASTIVYHHAVLPGKWLANRLLCFTLDPLLQILGLHSGYYQKSSDLDTVSDLVKY